MSTAIADKIELKLKSLTLKHFKGFSEFDLSPNGRSVNIFGANGTGKTSIGDAIPYLLFDKDMKDRSPDNFGIKTRRDGEELHGVDHIVEGKINGTLFKKVYHEKWVRGRGEANQSFKGHRTKHYVDGVPVKKGEYDQAVANLITEQLYKMLSNPHYFCDMMHWTDRREVLTDLVGDYSVEEIIEANDGLEEYLGVLDGKSEEDRKNILKESRKDLNEELDNIPSRIDENERALEEVTGLEEAKEKVKELTTKKEAIEMKRLQVRAGGTVSELKVKISELEAEKSSIVSEANAKSSELLADVREKLSKLNDRKDEALKAHRESRSNYLSADSELQEAKEKVAEIEAKITAKQEEKPKAKPEEKDEVCPMCERPYDKDEENVEDHYDQYLKEFNSQKALDLKALDDSLGDAKEKVNYAIEALSDCEKAGLKTKATLNQVTERVEKVEAELKEKKENFPDPRESEEYIALTTKQEEYREKISNHEEEKAQQVEALTVKIQELDQEILDAQRVIHQQEKNEKILARIEELQEERKALGKELESAEHDLHIIEEFVRARSAFITDKLNNLFEQVEWQLFKEQVNGGIDECAEPLLNGVPFSSGLNSAGQIQAGLEVIKVLSDHYGKSVPVVIDNRESVTHIPDMDDIQIINLIVSPDDSELRIETAQQQLSEVA